MKLRHLLAAVVVFAALGACQNLLPYSDSVLTGTISGITFTFVDGYIDADGDIQLYDQAKDFTSFSSFTYTYPQVVFSIPEIATAEYTLKLDLLDLAGSYTITGVPSAGSNNIFTDGNMEITEVTTATVSGRMHITTDSDELNGTFVLERVTW